MSVTVSTFGVTPADLTASAHNLALTDRSAPTYDQAVALINRVAGRLCSALADKNISFTGLSSDDATYLSLQQALIHAALAEILVGRDRVSPETVAYHERQRDLIMAQLREHPDEVQQRDDDEGPQRTSYIGGRTTDFDESGYSTSMAYKVAKGGL